MPATLFGYKVPHSLWLEVKQQAVKEGYSNNWRYIMALLKKRMNLEYKAKKYTKKSLSDAFQGIYFRLFSQTGSLTKAKRENLTPTQAAKKIAESKGMSKREWTKLSKIAGTVTYKKPTTEFIRRMRQYGLIKNEDYQNFDYVTPAYRTYKVGSKHVAPFSGDVYKVARNGGFGKLKPKRKKNMGIRSVLEKAEKRQGLRFGWDTRQGGASGERVRAIRGPRGFFETITNPGETKPGVREYVGARYGRQEKVAQANTRKQGRRISRTLYRKLGFSKKSIEKADNGSLSFGEITSKIRTAFDETFCRQKTTSPEVAPVSSMSWHVSDNNIFPTYVIAEEGYSGTKFVKVSYKIDGNGNITFGKPQKVKMVFQVTKSGEVTGIMFQKAEKQGLKFGWSSRHTLDRSKIFNVRGNQGTLQIARRSDTTGFSGMRHRKVSGKKEFISEYNTKGKEHRRKLYRKLGLSTKSLTK